MVSRSDDNASYDHRSDSQYTIRLLFKHPDVHRAFDEPVNDSWRYLSFSEHPLGSVSAAIRNLPGLRWERVARNMYPQEYVRNKHGLPVSPGFLRKTTPRSQGWL